METLGKPKMGKLVQQSDMNFIIEKIWNFYNQQSNHPTWRNNTLAESLDKSQRTQHTLSVTVRPLRQQYDLLCAVVWVRTYIFRTVV